MAPRKSNKEPHIIDENSVIQDSDDEEIDEDEAFNSEDELKYGSFFTSSSIKKKNKKSSADKKNNKTKKGKKSTVKLIGEEDKVSEDDDDDDDSGSSSSEDDDSEEDHKDWAGASSDDDDSNDDDDDEEEDDGGQYMLDLLNNLDKQVDGKSTTATSNKQHSNKQQRAPTSGEGNGKIQLNHVPAAAVHLKESEFQAGTMTANNTSLYNAEAGSNKKLTLDSLMGGISDTQGFASVQRTMRVLSSGGVGGGDVDDNNNNNNKGGNDTSSAVITTNNNKKLTTTAAPLPRVITERASRKVHYQSTTQDVTQWKQTIHDQRDAETLDFRPNKGGHGADTRLTRDILVSKFEARTEFEEELAKALEVAGMEDEKRMKKREKKKLLMDGGAGAGKDGEEDEDGNFDNDDDNDDDLDITDDLGSNRISMEEYKKRHAELSKMRALLFYEEQKRHRINKIKSKKYRKIRKRQRDRLTNAEEEAQREMEGEDPALERERVEKEEMDRMKERMTLAHKNTSKWARRVLRRGKNVDVEERRALSLQIAKGEELRRKVMGVDEAEGGSDDDDDYRGETEQDLLKRARDILMETEDDSNGDNDKDLKKKGLFQLEFMKKGMEAQRNRAKEEARRLLEELEANEAIAVSTDSSDDDEDDGVDTKKQKKKPKFASESETNLVLPEGKLVASSLQFGKSGGFSIAIDGNIELNADADSANDKTNEADSGDDYEEEDVVEQTSSSKKKKKNKKKKKAQGEKTIDAKSTAEDVQEEENPWIKSESEPTTALSSNKSMPSKKKSPSSWTVNIDEAASMLVDDSAEKNKSDAKRKRDDSEDNEPTANEVNESTPSAEMETDKSDVGVANLSQAELVRRAFAAPADLEAEEEFQKEKVCCLVFFLFMFIIVQ